MLCVDVDRLKAINDDFGHKAGDGALVAVCRALLDNVRTIDVVARIGGDEFAVLLPETSAAQASALSQRVLAEVAWQGDVLASGLAISIGIAELNDCGGRGTRRSARCRGRRALPGQGRRRGRGTCGGSPPERGSPWAWRALDHAARGSAG